MRLLSGNLLGPYEIVGPLGAGGMGEVYRARDRRLSRDVAVKVLPNQDLVNPERLRRLEQEARAAGSLNHPNILAIHDIGTADGATYVVSELLDGETLRVRLGGDALPLRKAIDYGVQIASGLAAAHEKGIVHRDLKPENLFVTQDGRIKILDFGLAKLAVRAPGEDAASTGPCAVVASETDPGMVLGTAGYMSPEQVRALPADHRSDIFSFGAVLFEMLSGRRAFRRDTAAETMTAILKDDPPELADPGRLLPPAVDRLVRRCLEKRPEERFQSARDVAFALEALSGVSGSGALPAVVGGRPRRMRTATAALAGLTVLLAGLLTGRFGWKAPDREPPLFTQLTFRRGWISSARFAPDGQTVVYSAAWEGQPVETFSARPGSPEWRSLGVSRARLLSISPSGEMAMLLGGGLGLLSSRTGTLAHVPLAGGAPREVLESIDDADWSPDGRSMAIVRSVDGRNRLEFPAGKALYETAGGIGYPRVSPDGRSVAFLDWPVLGDDRGSVAVVDAEGRMRRLTGEQKGTQGLAWTPDGREVWFTAGQEELNRALRAVSLSGRQRLLARVPGVLKLQDVAPGGRALLVHDNQHFGIMGLWPGETKERDLSWFETSWAGDLSSDGRTLAFSESESRGHMYSVYLRRTDGSTAIRLGEGGAQALSPDGRWVLAVVFSASPELALLPTGPGERRTLPRGPIQNYVGRGTFFPGGREVLVAAHEAGHGVRLYRQDLEGGLPRAITPEGVTIPWASRPISPDGRQVAALGPHREPWVYPIGEGEARKLPGLNPGDWPLVWTPDGRTLFVGRLGEQGAEIDRYEPATGRREPWRRLALPDLAGVRHLPTILLTPDGKVHGYGYVRTLSHLYLVDGLE